MQAIACLLRPDCWRLLETAKWKFLVGREENTIDKIHSGSTIDFVAAISRLVLDI